MKVLLDNNFPLPFRHELKTCEVETAAYRGWEALGDDELLRRGNVWIFAVRMQVLRYGRESVSVFSVRVDLCR